MKKFISRLSIYTIIIAMALQFIPNTIFIKDQVALAASSNAISEGSYVQLGSYNGVPIIWRVIHKNPDGSIMLFSDKIITLKAFDAKGDNTDGRGDANRINNGSNYWEKSNIREWLNSSSSTVTYSHIAPDTSHVTSNPYSTQAGFLSNFTTVEQNTIQNTTNKVILATTDTSVKDGGSVLYAWTDKYVNGGFANRYETGDYTGNYDSAYYKNVTDKVFFLSVKDLESYVCANTNLSDRLTYYIGYPTQQAVNNSNYNDGTLSTSRDWSYWLSTPYPTLSFSETGVGSSGNRMYGATNTGSVGVRPSLTMKSGITLAGTGTKTDPYRMTAPSAPGAFTSPSVSTIKSGSTVTVTWADPSDWGTGSTHNYILEFYNGSSWITISSSLTSATTSYTVPTAELTGCKFRVKASTEHGTSSWVESSTFKVDNTSPTATVSYSTTSPTPGNVIATITPSETVTVTNNGGSTSYTFTSNGSFTFNFTDAVGNTGSAVATVNNIQIVPTLDKPNVQGILGQVDSTVTTYTNGSACSSNAIPPIAKDNLGNIYVAYGKPYGTQSYRAMYVKKSIDGGINWQYWNGTAFSSTGTETPISTNSDYHQSNPSIAIDSNNNVHVIWDGWSNVTPLQTYTIRYSKFNGTSWSSTINITTANYYDQFNASLSIDSNNNLHIIWKGYVNGAYQIRYSKSTNGGPSWSTPINISSGTYEQSNPRIAIDGNNNLHAVWYGKSTTSTTYNQIRYSKSTNGGTSWGTPIELTTGSYGQSMPSIAIDSSNNIHVVWNGTSTSSPSNNQIRYIKYNGTSWSTPIDLTTGVNYGQYPNIAVDSNNNLHVVWVGPFSSTWQIRYSKSINGGTSWSTPVNFTSGSFSPNYPNISKEASFVTWQGTCDINGVTSGYNGITISSVTAGIISTKAPSNLSTTGTNINQAAYRIFYTKQQAQPSIDTSSNAGNSPGNSWIDSGISGDMTISGNNITQTISPSNFIGKDWTYVTFKVWVQSSTSTSVQRYSDAYKLTQDTTAPTLTITSSTANPTNANSITYTFTFSETVTGFDAIDITVTNGTKGTFSGSGMTYNLIVTNSGSSTQTVNVPSGACIDAAGNLNTSANISVTIDNVAPPEPTANPLGGVYNVNKTIILSDSEAGTRIRYTTNGTTPTATSSLYSYQLTISTTTTLKAVAYDAAGNASSVMTQTYTIDKTPPTGCSIIINSGDDYTNVSSLSLSLGATDAVKMFLSNSSTVPTSTSGAVSGTSTGWVNYTTNYSWSSFSGDGTKTIYAWFKDSAENISTVVSDSIIYDSTPPTATVSYSTTLPTSASVIATITPSETVTVTNNGGLKTYTFTSNGNFTFNFTDAAGNIGSVIATVNNIQITPTLNKPIVTGNIYLGENANLSSTGTNIDQASYRIYYTTLPSPPTIDDVNGLGAEWIDAGISGSMNVNSSTSISQTIAGVNFKDIKGTYITFKVAAASTTDTWVTKYSDAISITNDGVSGIGYVGYNQIVTKTNSEIVLSDPNASNKILNGGTVTYRLEFDITSLSNLDDIETIFNFDYYNENDVRINPTSMRLVKILNDGSETAINYNVSFQKQQGENIYKVLLGDTNINAIIANGVGRYGIRFNANVSINSQGTDAITNIAQIKIYETNENPYIIDTDRIGRKGYIKSYIH